MSFRTDKEYETKKESASSKRFEKKARVEKPAPLPVSNNTYVLVDPEGRTYTGERKIGDRKVKIEIEHGMLRTNDEEIMKYMCSKGFVLFDTYKMEANNGRSY